MCLRVWALLCWHGRILAMLYAVPLRPASAGEPPDRAGLRLGLPPLREGVVDEL